MFRMHDAAQQMNDSQPSVVSEAFCFSLIRIAQALHRSRRALRVNESVDHGGVCDGCEGASRHVRCFPPFHAVALEESEIAVSA